jgi:hypothetical protein
MSLISDAFNFCPECKSQFSHDTHKTAEGVFVMSFVCQNVACDYTRSLFIIVENRKVSKMWDETRYKDSLEMMYLVS